jgi:hypothetical protein
MTQAHLSTERLQALHDGEPGHPRELEHLASCPVCREAFVDSRWTILLSSLRSATGSVDEHPDLDELLAFQTGALSTRRQASIREHLSRCRRCMTGYARMRAESKRARYSTPSRELVRATMTRFRPRTMKRLGRLLVERVGEDLALSILRMPEPSPYLRTAEAISETRLDCLKDERRDPASASGRAMRMQRIGGRDSLADQVYDECAASDSFQANLDATVEDSPWNLRVSPIPDAAVDSLRITLGSTDERRSVAEVTLRIVPESGDEISVATDARGVAVLPCPPGSSRLIVEVEPPLSVEVRFEG